MNLLKRKGYFIVIDGTDGAGKATQIELLKKVFAKKKIDYEVIDFPRYEDNIYGQLVGRYLKGEFGNIYDVNPYLMALAYAGDRALAKPLLDRWLKEGKVVIANRYVSANKAHMSANLKPEQRQEFLEWLNELEYKTNGIPQEDLTILLYVTAEVGQKNIDQKNLRKYIGLKKRDIHENNIKHLEEANKIYLELARIDPSWNLVQCMANGHMRPLEDIHEEIMAILKKKLFDKF